MTSKRAPTTMRVDHVAPALFVLVVVAFYAATLRPQETWIAGDFALYIMHAKNIALGLPYNDTMYLHNPENAIISPAAYPPGFPLLLSVAWLLSERSSPDQALLLFKLMNLFFLAGTVLLVYAIALPRLGFRWAFLLTVLFGVSPVVFRSRDLILSDIAFMFWCYAALLLCDLVRRRKGARLPVVGLALAVAMACSTRVAGVALAGALLATFLVRRRPDWPSALAVGAATLGAFAANRIAHTDAGTYLGYFERLRSTEATGWLIDVGLAYGRGIVEIFGIGFDRVTNAGVALLLVLIAFGGFLIRVRRGAGAAEFFAVLYTAMILLFPVRLEPVRYALPVVPLMMFYIMTVFAALAERSGRGTLVFGAVIAGFLVLYVPFYLTHDELSAPDLAVTDADSQALFRKIAEDVPADGLILARNPRVVGLFAQRHASIWPELPSDARFWSYADATKAQYLLQELRVPEPETYNMAGIIQRNPDRLDLLFRNGSFAFYRIRPAP
ncbi:hypothetical protein [Azospirillum sp. TSO35-2]|uniref:hypothetical protein n=1 Tax=Azospirillum sp. TSO35-2 TaxID=716796 RepID=UPI0011B3B859|nr:hypothetical protein [Azospirillum sp. TSO35-2]